MQALQKPGYDPFDSFAPGWPMFSQATEGSMDSVNIRQFADQKVLYLTTSRGSLS